MKKTFSNKILKTLLTSAISLSAVAGPVSAFAQTYEDLIAEQDANIENLNAQEAAIVDELNSYYAELESIEAQAGELMAKITEQAENLEALAEENELLEEAIANRQNLLDEQARAVQVTNGSTNYLAYVASAKDVKDFVGRVDTVRRMVTSNKELIDQQKSDQEKLEAKKAELEEVLNATINDRVELEQLKGQYIELTQASENAYNNVLNDKAIAQSTRDALVEEKAAYEAEQARLAAEAQAQAEAAAAAEAEAQAAQAQAEADALAAQEALAAAEAAQAEADAAQQAAAQATTAPQTQVVEEVIVNEETGEEEVVYNEVYVEPTYEETVEAPVVDNTAAQEAAAAAEAAQQRAAEAQAAAQAAQETAAASQANANSLIANAEQYIGTPYVWGGKSPSGFDCSGYTQYVYRETYGKEIGGWTGAQENAGTRISVDEAQAGDLYFWGEPGSTYHVAIATGDGNYIHAPQPGESVSYSKVNGYFQPSFALRVN